MTKIYCEEMMCGHCVSRIETALAGSKINHTVDLSEKLVTVDGDEACIHEALELLDDLGFAPVIKGD